MSEIFVIVCFALAIYLPWRIWYQGVKLDELTSRLKNAEGMYAASQEVGTNYFDHIRDLQLIVNSQKQDLEYWRNMYIESSDTVYKIEEYIVDHGLEENDLAKYILDLVGREDPE